MSRDEDDSGVFETLVQAAIVVAAVNLGWHVLGFPVPWWAAPAALAVVAALGELAHWITKGRKP